MVDAPAQPSRLSLTPRASLVPGSGSYDGEDFLFHLYRGSELLQDNCIAEAKEELERALAMQPRDVESQGLLGVVYFRLGMYPHAIEIFQELVIACPREATPRVNLALCYLKTGQPIGARDVLEDVIRMAPDHARAWGYLGLVFERIADYAKALVAFERAGQPHLARRMQRLIGEADAVQRASVPPEQTEMRRVAADAEREIDASVSAPEPFTIAADRSSTDASRSGQWRAIELGEEPLPPPSVRPPASLGSVRPPPPDPEATLDQVAPTELLGGSGPVTVPEAAPSGRALPLAELEKSASLAVPDRERAVVRTTGVVLLRIVDSFVVRGSAIRGWSGAAPPRSRPLRRRTRGKDLDEPLGGIGAPMVAVEGSGELVLAASDERRLAVVEIGGKLVYLREDCLVGFDGALGFESGRIVLGDQEALAVVQLSGNGLVVVELKRPLGSLPIGAGRSASLRGEDVVGWSGRVLPRPASGSDAPAGLHGCVGFSGEGAVLVEIG